MSAEHPAAHLAWARHPLLVMAACLLAVVVACGDATTPAQTPIKADKTEATEVLQNTPSSTLGITDMPATAALSQMPFVRVDEVVFPVELAVTPAERIKGLSGRAFLESGTGMLFVFDVEDRLRFWMREMEIPLDMVWIGANCKVVDISVDISPPAPGTPVDDLPRYSPSGRAMYVLEINGGESERLGIGAGDLVKFVGALAGRYGC